jgi:hypothetical protein
MLSELASLTRATKMAVDIRIQPVSHDASNGE